MTDLLTSGRRIGNIQRQGLSPRSVNQALMLLGSVLDDAVRQGTLSRNVAKLVERPSQVKKDMRPGPQPERGLPRGCGRSPFERSIPALPLRPTTWGDPRTLLVGYRPPGLDPDNSSGQGGGHRDGDRGSRTQDRTRQTNPATGRCDGGRSPLAPYSRIRDRLAAGSACRERPV